MEGKVFVRQQDTGEDRFDSAGLLELGFEGGQTRRIRFPFEKGSKDNLNDLAGLARQGVVTELGDVFFRIEKTIDHHAPGLVLKGGLPILKSAQISLPLKETLVEFLDEAAGCF